MDTTYLQQKTFWNKSAWNAKPLAINVPGPQQIAPIAVPQGFWSQPWLQMGPKPAASVIQTAEDAIPIPESAQNAGLILSWPLLYPAGRVYRPIMI
jgi:hypothetical protein